MKKLDPSATKNLLSDPWVTNAILHLSFLILSSKLTLINFGGRGFQKIDRIQWLAAEAHRALQKLFFFNIKIKKKEKNLLVGYFQKSIFRVSQPPSSTMKNAVNLQRYPSYVPSVAQYLYMLSVTYCSETEYRIYKKIHIF